MNREQLQIINWLQEVRFRKQLFGGVNEQDVWKKIEQLNQMYEAALRAERIRFDVLLSESREARELFQQTNLLNKEFTVDE